MDEAVGEVVKGIDEGRGAEESEVEEDAMGGAGGVLGGAVAEAGDGSEVEKKPRFIAVVVMK